MKVLVIGCGGTGVNWGKLAHPIIGNGENDASLLLIDGSDSNLRDVVDPTFDTVDKWICPNTDGAGKNRALCVKAYKEYLGSRIHELPEADLYIVAYSTAGGSGSVFGPELTLHLLSEGKAVVGVTMTSYDSKDDAVNTYNVIRGLSSYARKSGKPVVNFIQRGDVGTIEEADQRAVSLIETLIWATSEDLGGLDTADLKALLDYTRHGIEPSLTELVVSPDVESLRKDTGKYLTTLSVIPNLDADEPDVNELTNLRAIGGNISMYFGTRIDRMGTILEHAEERKTYFLNLAKSHQAYTPFDSDDEMEY